MILNQVMRYAHPQERHKADAMQKLRAANRAEMLELERHNIHTKMRTEENHASGEPLIN
jgi:hypothetical protein